MLYVYMQAYDEFLCCASDIVMADCVDIMRIDASVRWVSVFCALNIVTAACADVIIMYRCKRMMSFYVGVHQA